MTVSLAPLSQKQVARNRTSIYLANHGGSVFRGYTEEQFAAQAQYLLRCLKIVHSGDMARVIRELRKSTDEIADMEFCDPYSDGHHERAAEQIRRVADELSLDLEDELEYAGCPWRKVRPLLARHRIPAAFADILWKENRKRWDEWIVNLSVIGRYVWGEDVPAHRKISTTSSRLGKLLKDRGVVLKVTLNGRHQSPHVRCLVVSADEEKIEEVLKHAEKSHNRPAEQQSRPSEAG